MFDGKGKMKFENGDRYEGEWEKGMMDGQGTMEFSDGRVYCGIWFNNKMHGDGQMKYPNYTCLSGLKKSSAPLIPLLSGLKYRQRRLNHSSAPLKKFIHIRLAFLVII